MGNCFDKIYGNQKQKAFLMPDAADKRLAHAYIIEGETGSGRHTLAKTVIAALACEDNVPENRPCGVCESCRKIFSDICPDVIYCTLPSDRKTIGVESIRDIRDTLLITPNDLDIKAYIVENADAMTVQAQNAFLKMLEEPPEGVYFFIICESASSLLPTVRSRASVIRMQKFTQGEISEYILSVSESAKKLQASDKERFDSLVLDSNGSIGRALKLFSQRKSQKDAGGRYELIYGMFDKLQRADRAGFLLSYTQMPQKRDELAEFFTDFSRVICAVMKSKRRIDDSGFTQNDRDKISEISMSIPALAVYSMQSAIDRVNSLLGSINTNIQLTQIKLLNDIWDSVYKR